MADEEEKPRYLHDCDKCIFLGRYTDGTSQQECDLYVCLRNPTVVARYSGYGPSYMSGLPFAKPGSNPYLWEALRRAQAKGYLLDQPTEPEPPPTQLSVAERFARDFIKGGAFAQSDMVFVNHPDIGSQLILDVRDSGTLSMEKYGLSAAKVLDVQEAIGRFVAEAINEKLAREKATS